MEPNLESAVPIVSEIELSYHTVVKPSLRPKVVCDSDVYRLFLSTWDMSKIELYEQYKVMLLTNANRVLGICTLNTGTATATFADPRQVFGVALKANATKVILAHNHPSGLLRPSSQDIESTKRMKLIGKYLEIPVIDHLIISSERYYSFASEGII